jgi:hypothetical protein
VENKKYRFHKREKIMAVTIHDSQNWAAAGTQDAMANTYAAVKKALENSAALQAHDIEIFLQGSYANNTNTRGDSDVDIVVMLKSTWHPDKSLLSDAARAAYDRDHMTATYTAERLRADVVKALQDHFGPDRVKRGNKAVRVNKIDGFVDADVVPALQHRVYVNYDSLSRGRYLEGTRLYPASGDPIVNYPKIHKMKGGEKNASTNKNFKPAVRQVKRLRRQAAASGRLDLTKAPGYLIECMVFNAPDHVFVDSHHARLFNILNWFLAADLSTFKAVDTIHDLFRTDPGNYAQADAQQIIKGMVEEAIAT